MAAAHWKSNICAQEAETINVGIHICDGRLCLPRMALLWAQSHSTNSAQCQQHRDHCPSMERRGGGRAVSKWGVSNAAEQRHIHTKAGATLLLKWFGKEDWSVTNGEIFKMYSALLLHAHLLKCIKRVFVWLIVDWWGIAIMPIKNDMSDRRKCTKRQEVWIVSEKKIWLFVFLLGVEKNINKKNLMYGQYEWRLSLVSQFNLCKNHFFTWSEET